MNSFLSVLKLSSFIFHDIVLRFRFLFGIFILMLYNNKKQVT